MSKFHKITFKRIVTEIITYLEVRGRPSCDQEVVAIVAKPLRPWKTLYSCAVICVILLTNKNRIQNKMFSHLLPINRAENMDKVVIKFLQGSAVKQPVLSWLTTYILLLQISRSIRLPKKL